MKRFLKVMVVLAATLFVIGSAGSASAFLFELGANSSVDVSGTMSALEMYANLNGDLDSYSFDLQVGESSDWFLFGTFGTTESWVNDDDLVPGIILATLDFDNPDLAQAGPGQAVGHSCLAGLFQGWDLTWDGPITMNFGNGGVLEITFSDAGFDGVLSPAGSADVYAQIKFITEPTGIVTPLPGAVWMLGTGLIGLIGLRRKMAA